LFLYYYPDPFSPRHLVFSRYRSGDWQRFCALKFLLAFRRDLRLWAFSSYFLRCPIVLETWDIRFFSLLLPPPLGIDSFYSLGKFVLGWPIRTFCRTDASPPPLFRFSAFPRVAASSRIFVSSFFLVTTLGGSTLMVSRLPPSPTPPSLITTRGLKM